MTLEELYNSLTEEQKAQAMSCNSPEELVAIAKATGVELSDDLLEGIAGGDWNCSTWCGCDGVLCRDDSQAWS